MLELLAPAGSAEALRAAVQNGADAVYLGAGAFNARMSAANFSLEELDAAVTYCHIRGVKVFLTLNTLVTDREMPAAAEQIAATATAGVDAFIVQDLGVAALCAQIAPTVPVHASTQMSLHSLSGVRAAAELGIARVILARELSRENLRVILRNSPVETELFVHGALCMCHSGQCYLSSVVGQRSGNRGRCAQPCRLPYGYGRFEPTRYPMSLKDSCLLGAVGELDKMGCTSLKIEGRMKRPEYVAITTRIYRKAIDGAQPSAEELRDLENIFSRQGFTRGYYDGALGGAMFGVHRDEPPARGLLSQARASYESGELQRIPVRFFAVLRAGEPAMLAVEDRAGHLCKTTGPVPAAAVSRALTEQDLAARLAKTGGTPFYSEGCKAHIAPSLQLSAADINAMRRELLTQLTALRGRAAAPAQGSAVMPAAAPGHAGAPVVNVAIRSAEQLTPALRAANIATLYAPLSEIVTRLSVFARVPDNMTLCAILPRVITEQETPNVLRQLDEAYDAGVREALCGNLGHVALARSRGFRVRGDYGFNLFNSRTAEALQKMDLASVTASFELSLPQLRDLGKPVDTEMIVYGRLPLMLTENCLIKDRNGICACDGAVKLIDRKSEEFYLLRDPGTCRTEVLNGKKLYLLDQQAKLAALGLWGIRLQFTTESASQVDQVLRALEKGAPFDQGACTRGLYLRGVE
ncbi:MAG: DUF3656 domain-containing protein [Oscillospiraceae bacterium]|nr:DUF3656 domain-containing protein [Oscillospiraceae bacterium]